MTHNSGPLHRVISAGAARRSTNASLMPRRTNCESPPHGEMEREVGGVRGGGGPERDGEERRGGRVGGGGDAGETERGIE